jgi:hypothetical protein
MQALYGLLGVVGVVAAIFGLAWLGQFAARRQGAADERADATDEAREAEQEMTDIILQPTSPEDTKDKLNKGEF